MEVGTLKCVRGAAPQGGREPQIQSTSENQGSENWPSVRQITPGSFVGPPCLTGVNFQRCWSQGAQRLSEAGKPLRYRWPARLLIPDGGGPTLRHSRWVRWASGRKC